MRILVACEFSGIVRDAFRAKGHDAWSCDLLPTEADPTRHLQGDIFAAIASNTWDTMIAFPPCTYLANSGNRWWAGSRERDLAVKFVDQIMSADIPRIAVENPVGALSTRIRKPDQVIQPWQFGHGETKATCLWLKGLPKLAPTNVVDGREPRVHRLSPSPERWKERSRTYAGVAQAMADQWGDL